MATNRESRPLDFLYDSTYMLTNKERQKAEKNAQNLMRIKPLKTSNNPLQLSSNLKDILTIQKTATDHYSIDKPSTPSWLMLSESSGYESNNIKKQGVSTSKKYDEQKIKKIVDRLYYGYPKKKSTAIRNRLEECTLDSDYTRYVQRPQSKSSSLSSSLPNVKNAADNRRSPKFDDFKVWTSGDETSHQKSPNLSQNPLNLRKSTSRSEKNDRIETLREKLIFQSDCLRKYLDAKLKQLKIRHELDLRILEKSPPISTTPIVGSKNHREFAHRRIAKYLSDQKLIPNGHISRGNDLENQEKGHATIISPPVLKNDDDKDNVLSTLNGTLSEMMENIKNYPDTKMGDESSARKDDEIIGKKCKEHYSIRDQIKERVTASNFDCQVMQNNGDWIKNHHIQANFDTNRIDEKEIFAQKENQESIKSADAVKYGEMIMPQWTIKSYIDDLIEESMNAVIKYQTCEKIANVLLKKAREEKKS